MLVRLKVSGFKNLDGVDVRFGPFTCIAGANAVGKSNLFDAIRFLRWLADYPLVQAAQMIRGVEGGDVRHLFASSGGQAGDTMSFEAEILLPEVGEDDYGQEVRPASTLLRYSLTLGLREASESPTLGGLKLVREELIPIRARDPRDRLSFPASQEWLDSVYRANRSDPLIETSEDRRIITVSKESLPDDQGGRRPLRVETARLHRTTLSAASSAETRTALMLRREMQSWRLLQLEPASLRRPDSFDAPVQLGGDGSHLAATVYRLAHSESAGEQADPERTYAQLVARLAGLVEDLRELTIDRDLQRALLTLQVSGKDGTRHPAGSLSDGTLRFLALAVIERDPTLQGLLCLEEPENGIHPARIPAMLRLLRDIATDTDMAVGPDNPLRQVLITTHSPVVVGEVEDDDLLVAESRLIQRDAQPIRRADFGHLEGTWRESTLPDGGTGKIVPKGRLLEYLNALNPRPDDEISREGEPDPSERQPRRVVDRHDLQPYLPSFVNDR